MRRLTWLFDAGIRWKPLYSVVVLLLLSLTAGCVTTDAVALGCVCQSRGVLREISTGRLEHFCPETADWEREWHRDCEAVCDGR